MKIVTTIMTISILTMFYGFYLGLNDKYSDCGVIVEKSSEIKSGYKSTRIYNENYFLIKYSDGIIEKVIPTETTYYYKNVNDKVCYERTDYKKEKLSFILIMQPLGVFLLILIVILIITVIKDENLL